MSAPDDLVRAVEAALFAAEAPISAEEISLHLGGAKVSDALEELASHYAGRGVQLVRRGKLWHFQTAPDLAHLLRREREESRRLSRAATEVLAIVAYHEPVSRAEIEAIRGVQTAKGTLDVLMEAGWVRIAGRREVPAEFQRDGICRASCCRPPSGVHLAKRGLLHWSDCRTQSRISPICGSGWSCYARSSAS